MIIIIANKEQLNEVLLTIETTLPKYRWGNDILPTKYDLTSYPGFNDKFPIVIYLEGEITNDYTITFDYMNDININELTDVVTTKQFIDIQLSSAAFEPKLFTRQQMIEFARRCTIDKGSYDDMLDRYIETLEN